MTCVKLKMMGPLVLGLLGLKAMKALILSVIALTINKMSFMCKGGGDGGHSEKMNAVSSWDRNIDVLPLPPRTTALPY